MQIKYTMKELACCDASKKLNVPHITFYKRKPTSDAISGAVIDFYGFTNANAGNRRNAVNVQSAQFKERLERIKEDFVCTDAWKWVSGVNYDSCDDESPVNIIRVM